MEFDIVLYSYYLNNYFQSSLIVRVQNGYVELLLLVVHGHHDNEKDVMNLVYNYYYWVKLQLTVERFLRYVLETDDHIDLYLLYQKLHEFHYYYDIVQNLDE